MRILTALTIAIVVLLQSAMSHANGWGGNSAYCRNFESAHELLDYGDTQAMRDEVERRYLHAVDVSLSRSAIYSQNSLFTWANEAKISCAKALGYLKRHLIWRPVVNSETIQKCDCSYVRMMSYLQ